MDRLAPPAGVKSHAPAIDVADGSTAVCGMHVPDAPACPPASALPPVPAPPIPPDEVEPPIPPAPPPPSGVAPPLALDPPVAPEAVPPVPPPPFPGDSVCGRPQLDAAIRIARTIPGRRSRHMTSGRTGLTTVSGTRSTPLTVARPGPVNSFLHNTSGDPTVTGRDHARMPCRFILRQRHWFGTATWLRRRQGRDRRGRHRRVTGWPGRLRLWRT